VRGGRGSDYQVDHTGRNPFHVFTGSNRVSHEHTADGGDDADGDRAVSVLCVAVVIEEDFVAFPWRAGFVRGPVAFGVTGLLVLLVASPGGLGTGPLVDPLSLVGLVVYNAHNVPAATGLVPGAVTPVAEAVVGVPVLGRALRGLFVVGQNHAAPASHVLDVFGGKSGTIGHVNFIAQQDQNPAVLGSVGAGIVYVQLAGTSTADSEDATEQEPDA
jgi:hypothetical protein